MVLPVGGWRQRLWVISKGRDGAITHKKATAVTFVPMTGAVARPPEAD
jgi:protein-L-isoaspartate O-methyltransferase